VLFLYCFIFQTFLKSSFTSNCFSSLAFECLQQPEEPSPVNSKVLKLVEAASDPALLANMPPTWHPWF
jgi:hypothetical protein